MQVLKEGDSPQRRRGRRDFAEVGVVLCVLCVSAVSKVCRVETRVSLSDALDADSINLQAGSEAPLIQLRISSELAVSRICGACET